MSMLEERLAEAKLKELAVKCGFPIGSVKFPYFDDHRVKAEFYKHGELIENISEDRWWWDYNQGSAQFAFMVRRAIDLYYVKKTIDCFKIVYYVSVMKHKEPGQNEPTMIETFIEERFMSEM